MEKTHKVLKMFITIGMPLYNNMPIETFLSVLKILDSVDKKEYSFVNTRNYPIHYARNYLAEQFLKNKKSDYLLFLDSDMIFTNEETFIKRLLEIDADISSALAFKKGFPYEPTMYKKEPVGEKCKSIEEYEEGEIIEVDAVGMACCLIKRKVFETIKQPWFGFITLEDDFLGEDLTFCKKAKEAGLTIKVDTGLIAAHVGGIIDNKTFKGVRNLRKGELYPQIREDIKKIIEQMGEQQVLDMVRKKK